MTRTLVERYSISIKAVNMNQLIFMQQIYKLVFIPQTSLPAVDESEIPTITICNETFGKILYRKLGKLLFKKAYSK